MAAGGSAAVALTECETAWRDVPACSIVVSTLYRNALIYKDDKGRGTFLKSGGPWLFNRDRDGVLQGAWEWGERSYDLVVVVRDVDPRLSNDQIKALVSLCTAINTSV